MGVHVVKVPDIGEGVAEAELVAWHVKPGDTVAEDQALAVDDTLGLPGPGQGGLRPIIGCRSRGQ